VLAKLSIVVLGLVCVSLGVEPYNGVLAVLVELVEELDGVGEEVSGSVVLGVILVVDDVV
jgi:hypothetical protein